tara:strand:+ start:274 stop:888 length:615 start_codon:yes stop_codon:yes gene_type:complete
MYYFNFTDHTTNLHDYYKFNEPLSSNIIDKIIQLTEGIKYEEGKTQADLNLHNSEKQTNDPRRSLIKWVEYDVDSKGLYDILYECIMAANQSRWNFDLLFSPESLQYTEYRSSNKGHYDWHQDLLGEFFYRKLSLVIQLSDPKEYEGGELKITGYSPENNPIYTIPKQKGSVVIFPSYLYHRVTPVTKGIRKSLVWWVGGTPFK